MILLGVENQNETNISKRSMIGALVLIGIGFIFMLIARLLSNDAVGLWFLFRFFMPLGLALVVITPITVFCLWIKVKQIFSSTDIRESYRFENLTIKYASLAHLCAALIHLSIFRNFEIGLVLVMIVFFHIFIWILFTFPVALFYSTYVMRPFRKS